MFNGQDVANVVGGRGSPSIMDDPDPGSKTTPARASPLKRYVPQRKRADGTFENSKMDGSVHLIAPDPVERAAHRASIRSQLPPAITRPPPSTEYGRSCVKQMETELLQKILNIERNATKREAKDRRAQGLKVSDDDDDAKWIAAGFENWPEKRFDDLLVSMDRRHAEAGARFEARRKERHDEFTKEKGRTPNDDAEVDVWFEARREARRKKRVSLRLDAFTKEKGRTPNDDAEFDEWKAAIDAARNTKATTNFMSKLKQYNPDVPTVGWLVEVFDVSGSIRPGRTVKQTRTVYTPPPVLAGERTDVKIKRGKRGGKQGLRSLPDVWAYCEARWGAPTTVKAPVKRQMTLGFAVAPKKPRVE